MIFELGKKGDLRENTLGIVIAVLGILLILFGAYKLYSVFANQEDKLAQTLVNTIETKLNAIGKGNAGKFTVQGIKTGDESNVWYLLRYEKGGASWQYRPEKCYFESCICVCKLSTDMWGEIAWDFLFTSVAAKKEEIQIEVRDACQAKGYCRSLGVNRIYFPGGGIRMGPELVELRIDWNNNDELCVGVSGRDGNFDCVKT